MTFINWSDSHEMPGLLAARAGRTYSQLRPLATRILALVFFVEFVIFFGAAIHHGFPQDGWRLILAVAAFLSAFVASVAFGRRVPHPDLLFFGLLLAQLPIGAVANAVARRIVDWPFLQWTAALPCSSVELSCIAVCAAEPQRRQVPRA